MDGSTGGTPRSPRACRRPTARWFGRRRSRWLRLALVLALTALVVLLWLASDEDDSCGCTRLRDGDRLPVSQSSTVE